MQNIFLRITRFLSFSLVIFTLAAAGQTQSAATAGGAAQPDPGSISGNTYTNNALGFSYEFPAGWHVLDKATQEKVIEAGHQAAYGDDLEAAKEHEKVMNCMRILLWTNKNPEPAQTKGINPLAIVFALSPSCFPGIKFPSSSDDREGIKQAVEAMQKSFAGGLLLEGGKQEVSTFTLQQHLFLNISMSAEIGKTEDSKPLHIYASIMLTPLKDQWLVWMLASDTEAEFNKIKKLKVTLRVPTSAIDDRLRN